MVIVNHIISPQGMGKAVCLDVIAKAKRRKSQNLDDDDDDDDADADDDGVECCCY